MANQYLGLALFLMLLSFFIILNAMSDFKQDKAAPVLNSLTMAFTPENPINLEAGQIESVKSDESEGSTLDKIQGLFNARISGMEAKQNRMGTELRLRLSLDDFKREVESSLSGADGSFFIETLISLMDTQNATLYKMDMVAHASGEDRFKASETMSAIAGKIQEAGLPPSMISAGLGEDEAGMVDLHFRPYSAFDAEAFRQGTDL